MGVINCTPDSFYPDSRNHGIGESLDRAREMLNEGADILDIGGESTRPGSDYVEVDEEINRIIPVIDSIRQESDIPLSVDTRKSAVAERALDAGADIVNDVSALRDDPGLGKLVANRGVPVVLMHARGTPKTMQKDPRYQDTVGEIKKELRERIDDALQQGIQEGQVIVDPGIGFGKRLEDNLAIIAGVGAFREMGFPLLLGLSRKSFIDKLLGRSVEERLPATLAAEIFAMLQGVEILRVHDVRETVDAVEMVSALRGL